LLGTWARGAAGGLTIGVIGMPNVGKSSLINSLKRSRACNVGAKPGVTRACQIVSLDSKLKLIDSPGVIFSKEKGSESMTVETILTRVPKSKLMLQYGIGDFKDSEQFLCNVAMKFGQMKKGGIPNPTAAEQKIIHDWHTGAIRFFTEPPELKSATSESSIVTGLSAPFSLDSFVPSLVPDEDMEGSSDDDISEDKVKDVAMSDDEVVEAPQRRVTRSVARKSVTFAVNTEMVGHSKGKKKLKAETKDSPQKSCFPSSVGRVSVIATKKAFMKKIKKAKKKSAKHASELSDMVETMSFNL
jgi:nuclear GTP-binding protein